MEITDLDLVFVLLSTALLLAGIGWPLLHSWASRRHRAHRLRADPHHPMPRTHAPGLGPLVVIAVGLGLLVVSGVV
jgi:hypothetical protein